MKVDLQDGYVRNTIAWFVHPKRHQFGPTQVLADYVSTMVAEGRAIVSLVDGATMVEAENYKHIILKLLATHPEHRYYGIHRAYGYYISSHFDNTTSEDCMFSDDHWVVLRETSTTYVDLIGTHALIPIKYEPHD